MSLLLAGWQELLGHCSQLYQSNRAGMQCLQAHLQQYGYHPQALQQPSNPLTLVQSAASFQAGKRCFTYSCGQCITESQVSHICTCAC